jgi:DNA gyrase inhibitor GyrI
MESYQWYDCDAQAVISDETDSIYTPITTGQYAVITSNGECVAISACFLYTFLEKVNESHISVYPNPFTEIIQISISPEFQNETLAITSADGRQILKQKLNKISTKIVLHELPSGVYYLIVVDKIKSEIKKIVKW